MNKSQESDYSKFVDNILTKEPSYDALYSKFHGSLPVAHKCFREDACLGGLKSNCTESYKGLLCNECEDKHFLRMNTCIKCPTKVKAILKVAGVMLCFILVLVAVVWGDSKRAGHNRTWADVILSRFKIIVSFYQVIIGVFSALSRVQWPVSVLTLTKWLKYVEANILELAPLSCIDPRLRFDTLQQFTLAVCLNACGVATFLLYLFITRTRILYKKNLSSMEKKKAISAVRKSCYRGIFLFLFTTYPSTCVKIMQIMPHACIPLCFSEGNTGCSSFLRSELSIQCFTSRHNKYWHAAAVFLLYPVGFPLLILALLWKYYYKPSKTEMQLIEPNVSVNSSTDTSISNSDNGDNLSTEYASVDVTISHAPSGMNSGDVVLHDPVAECSTNDKLASVPFEMLCNVPDTSNEYISRKQAQVSDLMFSLSLFYENYKKRFWFWEVIEMYRKLVLMTGLALIGSQSRSQIGIGVLLAGGFSMLHAAYQPIADKFENALQAIALLVIFFDLTLGVMLKISDADIPVDVSTKNDATGVGVLFVVVNCLVIAVALGESPFQI